MTDEARPKSFNDLVAEVHEQGFCGECGGCVSFCSAHDLKAIEMPKQGPPVYVNEDACLHCGICYLICPLTRAMDQTLAATFIAKQPAGSWRKVVSCKASSSEVVSASTDGGVVTALLMYLLDRNIIDGAIVSKSVGPFQRAPFFARTRQELLEAAGSSMSMAGNVVALDHYSTFIPAVSALNMLSESDRARVVLVGTPCQVHSLRKMQALRVLPSHVVKHVFGLFCNMNFTFDEESLQALGCEHGFSAEQIEKINIREVITLETRDKKFVRLSFDEMRPYARRACMACPDYSNMYADISFGGVGSKPGYTTAMIRSVAGEGVYQGALAAGYVSEPLDRNTVECKLTLLEKVLASCKEKASRASTTVQQRV